MNQLRKLTFTGIPSDIRGIRPIVWQVILGSLTTNTGEWEQTLRTNHQTYEDFKRELIVKPQLKA